jgi:hypothetical protein
MEVTDGQTDRLVWPTTRLSVAQPAGLGRDLVLVHGIEPNMRWRGFSSELVAAFAQLDVEIVILLGALLADSPHTRPVPVSAGASDADLAARLHVEPVDYKGPTGIVGVLQHACATSSPSRTPRSPTTCGRWKRPRTRPTCRKPAGMPSPASSSATCAGAATAASTAAGKRRSRRARRPVSA